MNLTVASHACQPGGRDKQQSNGCRKENRQRSGKRSLPSQSQTHGMHEKRKGRRRMTVACSQLLKVDSASWECRRLQMKSVSALASTSGRLHYLLPSSRGLGRGGRPQRVTHTGDHATKPRARRGLLGCAAVWKMAHHMLHYNVQLQHAIDRTLSCELCLNGASFCALQSRLEISAFDFPLQPVRFPALQEIVRALGYGRR